MTKAKSVDGEAFALLTEKASLSSDVKLNLVPIESDRITSDYTAPYSGNNIDGVILDENGDASSYIMQETHPGNTCNLSSQSYRTVPRSNMLHWFRQDRPEQHRGISELTPALPLFEQIRQYTQATIQAAETSASYAGIIDRPADVYRRKRR